MKKRILIVIILCLIAGMSIDTHLYSQNYTGSDLKESDARGMDAYNKGDYNIMVEAFTKSAEICEKLYGTRHIETSIRYNNLGEAYRNKKDYDRAIVYHEKSLTIRLEVLGEKHLDTEMSYNNLGLSYDNKGDYDRAIGYYEKSLAIKVELLGEMHPEIATSNNNLGGVYKDKGDYDRAIEYYKKALVIYLKVFGESHREIATSYNSLGGVYYSKGDYNRAIGYYEKSLAIRLEVFGEKHSSTVTSYNNLGVVYFSKGDYDRAIGYHEKALAIKLEVLGEKHPSIATSYNNLGADYGDKGDYNRAIGYYEKSLAIRLEVFGEKHSETASSYNNLGGVYYSKGDYDKAIGYYEKALAINREVLGEKHPYMASSYNNLGVAYERKGDYDKAIGYHEKALSINREVLGEKHPTMAKSYAGLGVAYERKGDYSKSIGYHEKALAINRETKADQETVIFAQNLGSTYLDTKNFHKAFSSFFVGIETIEKVRKLNLSGGTDFTSRNISSYYYAAHASYLDKNMNNMFNISERMRAMGYLERLSLKEAIDGAGVDPEQGKKLLKLKDDIERLSSFRQKLISMEVYKLNEEQKKERDRQLEDTSKQLADAEAQFIKLDNEFMKNEKYMALRDTSVVSAEEAQKLCGSDGAIIEYIIPEKSDEYMKPYALVITAKSVQAVELDSAFNASEQIEKYRTAIKDGKEKDINRIGTELYTKLLAPVKGIINSPEIKKLIIVPDGSLAFLPFDSLKSPEGEYISERYELSLTPSVTVSVMTRKREYKNSDRLLAFGGGIYSSTGESKPRGDRSFRGMAIEEKEKEKIAAKAYSTPSEYYNAQQLRWSDLPGTEREVTAINEKIYKKKNTGLYTGEKVSESNIKSMSKQGKLKDYSKIHLACHGYYDPEYPAYSAVVFSEVSGKLNNSKDDGYMSVEETALLNLRSDIVVLSACETGMGKLVRGDGVIGLTRAFQVAGSNSVLVTLWPVNDDATEAFMVSMYAKVRDGMSYREAMVKVKEEFRRSKGSSRAADYSAPYFWAGFVLYE